MWTRGTIPRSAAPSPGAPCHVGRGGAGLEPTGHAFFQRHLDAVYSHASVFGMSASTGPTGVHVTAHGVCEREPLVTTTEIDTDYLDEIIFLAAANIYNTR